MVPVIADEQRSRGASALPSLGAKGFHRVGAGGAAGRRPGGGEGHGGEKDRHGAEDRRVVRADAVEDRLDGAPEAPGRRQADRGADDEELTTSERIRRRTEAGSAPRAIRTPISWRRCATENASTP